MIQEGQAGTEVVQAGGTGCVALGQEVDKDEWRVAPMVESTLTTCVQHATKQRLANGQQWRSAALPRNEAPAGDGRMWTAIFCRRPRRRVVADLAGARPRIFRGALSQFTVPRSTSRTGTTKKGTASGL